MKKGIREPRGKMSLKMEAGDQTRRKRKKKRNQNGQCQHN